MKIPKEKLFFKVFDAISLKNPANFLEEVFRILSEELPIDLVILWILNQRSNNVYCLWTKAEKRPEIKYVDKNLVVYKEYVYIPDISKSDNKAIEQIYKHGFRSVLLMSLLSEKDKRLVLGIVSKKANAFSKDDLSFLCKIQKALSSALKLWLYQKDLKKEIEDLKRKINEKEYELQVLYELSKSLGYTLSYDELLNLMAQYLHRVIEYDVVATLLVLDDVQKLVIYPAKRVTKKVRKQIKEKILDAFFKLKGEKPDQLQVIQKEVINKEETEIKEINSVFQVPIISPEEFNIVGLILVGSEKVEAFSENQIKMVYRVAQHASESLQKIRNLLNLEQKRLETVLELMQEGVILLDRSKKVIYANPVGLKYLAQLSGISQGERLTRLGYVPIEQFLTPLPAGQWHILSIKKPEFRVFEVGSRLVENGIDQGGWIIVLRDVTDHRRALFKYRKALEGAISALTTAIEKRDPYTAGHQRRVAELAREIAKEMKLPDETVNCIYLAGLLHDIGKISVPLEILTKPGRLNEPEYEIIKFHPVVGYEILKDIDFPWPIAEAVLYHHERMDGSGYPKGLKDGEIPIEARVLAVADVVEAISSHRPYRPALGIKAALEEIEKNKGKLYDPAVVDACVRVIKKGLSRNKSWPLYISKNM